MMGQLWWVAYLTMYSCTQRAYKYPGQCINSSLVCICISFCNMLDFFHPSIDCNYCACFTSGIGSSYTRSTDEVFWGMGLCVVCGVWPVNHNGDENSFNIESHNDRLQTESFVYKHVLRTRPTPDQLEHIHWSRVDYSCCDASAGREHALTTTRTRMWIHVLPNAKLRLPNLNLQVPRDDHADSYHKMVCYPSAVLVVFTDTLATKP